MWLIILLITIITAVVLSLRVFNFIQLEGYRIKFSKRLIQYMLGEFALTALSIVVAVGVMLASDGVLFDWVGLIIAILPTIALVIFDSFIKRKTPLKLTKRMTRLIVVYVIIASIFTWLLIYLGELLGARTILIPVVFAVNPLVCFMALIATMPIERLIKKSLMNKAKSTLENAENLIKIGITGSYGKTSVKFILEAMLKKKFNVVASRNSYNTPMGMALTVKEINHSTEVLIMEMGARRSGDIKELCEIVRPDIGIITGIAPQHLATFKTLDNVIKTKYELVASLPREGAAFFNGNDENARRLFYRATLGYKYLSLVGSGYIYASDIISDIDGEWFNLHIGDEVYSAHTKLLGEHNVENILLAANVANYLGVKDEDIVSAISEIGYTPHRMELIKSNGMYIIDDSYNCNTVGAKRAIETIAKLPNRKIVATQGIVELGASAKEENYRLGLLLSGVADLVFTIGVNGKAIVEGLLDGGYNPTRIISVDNLEKAQEMFSSTLQVNDVLLLMNDLPDNWA